MEDSNELDLQELIDCVHDPTGSLRIVLGRLVSEIEELKSENWSLKGEINRQARRSKSEGW